MYSENRWKVILLLAASVVAAEPSRALSLVYQKPRGLPMFVPKSYYKRRSKSRVLFLDEDENRQPFGRGEIDLTDKNYNSKIKFDDASDYEFTSPGEGTEPSPNGQDEIAPSGNDRFYEPLPRLRSPFQYPKYYQGRFSRPYAPNFGFDPYVQTPYAPALRNSLYNGWKARSPRVVFPYSSDNPNSVQTNAHAGPGFNDNVVFRDQNFGLNDIGAEDQTLQDIGTGSSDAFAERDANDPHRALYEKRPKRRKLPHIIKPMFIQTNTVLPYVKRFDYEYPNATLPAFKPISDAQMTRVSEILKDISTNLKPVPEHSTKSKRRGKLLHPDTELDGSKVEVVTETVKDRQDEDCAQGGTCEFFFYCWMVGGLLEGSCGGLLKGCCHRVAKAGILGVHDSNSIEYTSNELSFGPVINDDSKWIWSLRHCHRCVTLERNFKSF